MTHLRLKRAPAWVAFIILLYPAQTLAQASGCTAVALPEPPRQAVLCPGGLQLTAETSTTYQLLVRGRAETVIGVELVGGAVLIDTGGRRRDGFQVRTPHAIAAVRGTRYAADVEATGTAIFVVEGLVRVRQSSGRAGVTLGPGEGVDVAAGPGVLSVRRWSPERRAGLLGRLGER